MTRTIAAALVAAAIAACTVGGAAAQNLPSDIEVSPLLTGSDIGGEFTAISVNQPTFVLVAGDSKVCSDAVQRVQAAAMSLKHMTVVIARPSATSKTKDMTWALVFTPGFNVGTAWARTFGQAEFNACAHGDKLAKFLSEREFHAGALMNAGSYIKAIEGRRVPLYQRLSELYSISQDDRTDSDRVEIRDVESRIGDANLHIRIWRQRIDEILAQEMADARLQPERLSPQ